MTDLFKTAGSSPPADLEVVCHGSVGSFSALTPAARTWVHEHVQLESWQWLGNAMFIVDHRVAQPLIDAAIATGLEVQ